MQEWILLNDGLVLYTGLFFMLMGGAVGLPIPEDLPLILAGIVVQSGNAPFAAIFLVCYIAILLGDFIIYSIGRKFGPALFSKAWFQKRVSKRNIASIRVSLERRSLLMIFIARHLFYMRTVTFLTCGAVKMRPLRFVIADSIAALVSVPVMMSVGFFAAEHYEIVMKRARELSLIIPLLILIAYLFYKHRQRKKVASNKLDSGQDVIEVFQDSNSSESSPDRPDRNVEMK